MNTKQDRLKLTTSKTLPLSPTLLLNRTTSMMHRYKPIKRRGHEEIHVELLYALTIDANLSFIQFYCRKFPTLHLHPDDFPPPRVAALGGFGGLAPRAPGGGGG